MPISHRMKRLLVSIAALVTAALVAPASADEAADTRAQRERVREQQAALIAELDVLRAQDAEIEAALAQLEANLAAEQALLAEAEQAALEAEARLAAAEAAVEAAEAEIEEHEDELRRLAVQAYITSGVDVPAAVLLRSSDASDAVYRLGLLDSVATDIDRVIQRLERARRRLEAQQERAEAAAEAARQRRQEAEERVQRVEAARLAMEDFAAELQARIDARLREADALAAMDRALGEELRRQQEELAARIRAGAGGGGSTVSLVDPADLRTVRGITVHRSIADQLEALLAHAEADGIVLGGWGYRSSARQIELRRQHCPDVWSSPPSACNPPTARPGRSLHEQGLAIDFTHGGRTIGGHDSPAFQWLAANAERYGFYNLPSEPWHWSVTGA